MSRSLLVFLLAAGCTPPVTAPSAPASTVEPTARTAPGATESAPALSPEPPPDWHLAPASSAPFASSPACKADDACGWARCHAAGRCAFPCAADGDCQPGALCLASPGNRSVNVCTMP